MVAKVQSFSDIPQQCQTVRCVVNASSGNLLQLVKLGKGALSLSVYIQIVLEGPSFPDGTY